MSGGWKFTTNVEDVPEGTGYYALYRGDSIAESGSCAVGCGVTWNMRRSLKELASGRKDLSARPLYSYKPDTDGSAAKWLKGS